MQACCCPGSPYSVLLNMRYLFVQCSILKTAKQPNQQPGLIIAGFLGFYWDFFLRLMHSDIRYQILAILSVHHFKLIALINHHLMLSRSQQHTFGNNVTSVWLTQPFSSFKVQSLVCNLVILKLDGFSTFTFKVALHWFIRKPKIKSQEPQTQLIK